MFTLTATGALADIKAAADELDRHDPSPAEAVSWFEIGRNEFRLEVFVPTEQDAASAEAIIGAAAPELVVHVGAVEPADWVAMALDGLPPVRAGRFVVAGAHALSTVHGGRKRVWIEASEAFGTGHHGTTMGCLLALEHELRRRRVRRVYDAGCGSGVLAIAAAKAGARALGVEIDTRAAHIAAVNARQNQVAPSVRIRAGDAGKRCAGARYDLIFANILMRPLIGLAPRLTRALAPGGTLILSGILREQVPLVRQAYQNRGLIFARKTLRESWATLTLRKP